MITLNKKLIVTILGASSIFLAISINSVLSANQQKAPVTKVAPLYPVVSVTDVSPTSHQAVVTAYGEVRSRNPLSFTSQVTGQVTYISPKFLSGNTFKKGEVLIEIESVVYQQALANAQASLAEAKLSLAQELLNSSQAAQEWQQSGLADEEASELVLRKPQLAAARATHEMATKEVAKAHYDLAQTKLVAPFDALVVERKIQLGSNVQLGTSLAELYDISLFEIALPLTQQQWQLLPRSWPQQTNVASMQVLLADETNSKQWPAIVDRFEQHIDGESRQRSLVVSVANPLSKETALYPGTFVKATITGEQVSQLWKLPASALVNSHTVWQVNEESLLQYLPINVVFSQDNFVYVQADEALESAIIVSRPLSSYMVNMKVTPIIEETS